MICSQETGQLSEVIGDFKRFVCRKIAEKLDEDGRELWFRAMRKAAGNESGVKLWNEAFHPEQVHSKAFFEQKLAYMHNNPIRAGFVEDPCNWKYSSAGLYYRGEISLVRVIPVEW